MKSFKESPLAVSYSVPSFGFIRRKAKIYVDKSDYLFVQYSGETQIQERFNSEALTELLKLIPVIEYIYDEKNEKQHGIYNLPEINPHKVVSYLNRFGVIGISDIDFRNRVMNETDLASITRLTGLNRKNAQKLYKGKSLSPNFVERLLAIRTGDEVPYHLIEKILTDLAKSARLYLNLLRDPDFEKNRNPLSLTNKNRKRIVSAWHFFGGAFKDDEDPADPRFSLNVEWTHTKGGSQKIPVLDFAEGALSNFSQVMNKHLSLITKSVVTTQGVRRFNLENTGLEVAFSAYLVNAFKDKRIKRVCVECGFPFLPERIKEENKYCGERCSKKVRNRNYKAKKKISALKTGSKATTKSRKENK